MDFKDILVFLDAGDDTDSRLQLAISLCERFGSNLVGVDVSPPEAFENEYAERAVRLETEFKDALLEHPIEASYRVAERRTASWKDFYAHYADLVIATQREDASDLFVSKGIPDEVVSSAGVPVLVLPARWKNQALGESVILAWNSSRESTRAMHDSLPFLRQAKRVTIFEVGRREDDVDADPDLIRAHLGHHGVESELLVWPNEKDIDPLNALFACLDRQGADLIVAGAFGHPKLIESLFGSATHELLQNPSMPVLLSH